MLQELEKDNLNEIVSDNDTVVVQYMAGWCGNCRLMKPKFKKLASENENAKFILVDAEKYPESRKLATVDWGVEPDMTVTDLEALAERIIR